MNCYFFLSIVNSVEEEANTYIPKEKPFGQHYKYNTSSLNY